MCDVIQGAGGVQSTHKVTTYMGTFATSVWASLCLLVHCYLRWIRHSDGKKELFLYNFGVRVFDHSNSSTCCNVSLFNSRKQAPYM
jgi:hypothetical protein